jgi:HlyD family secretion protein
MRTLVKVVIGVSILGALGYFGATSGQKWLAERNRPRYRTAKLEIGDLRLSVNASGEVNPVLKVKIGSFVSGPIQKLYVDYNSEVRKGDPLADIDPAIYDAAFQRDTAALKIREAEVFRVTAELQRARNDEARSVSLKAENGDFISQAELDQYHFAAQGLEAQLQVAEAGVKQAEATLKTSEANVGYTKILSPVDGVVIDRMIDPGQTLAASFQAPELFVIAPGMREKMYIEASVDEADIGLIKDAQKTNQPVYFTVDAYPDEIFREGYIEQVRLSPKVNQQVVTYPVIVATPNPDLKLLPGMTANLTFQISELKNVLKIPNSALRWYPPDKLQVRESDQKLLELNLESTESDDDDGATSSQEAPVDDVAAATVAAAKRIVWVQETEADAAAARTKSKAEQSTTAKNSTSRTGTSDVSAVTSGHAVTTSVQVQEAESEKKQPATEGAAAVTESSQAEGRASEADATAVPSGGAVKYTGKLKAVEIIIGESDYRFTHVIGGDLKDGDEVIVGIKPPGTP